MKKLFYATILAVLAVMVGCTEKGYQITGTVVGAEDGDTVRVMVFSGNKLDTIHATAVKDGKFSISGQTDTVAFALVSYEGAGAREATGTFFLENGHIEISLNPDEPLAEISGTPLNEKECELNKAGYALNMKIEEVASEWNDSLSEEQMNDIRERIERLTDQMLQLYRQFIVDNRTNYAGQYYLSSLRSNFDEAFVREQIEAIPEADRTHFVKDMVADMEKKSAVAVGQPFIDFQALTPTGSPLSVSDVAKNTKVLMIDFWASWCGPCRAEMPNVKAVYEKFHAQGFDIVGVSLDDNADAWKKAIDELGMAWPQISDLQGWESEGARLYFVEAIPSTVLVKDGKIAAHDLRGEQLGQKVEELLAE